MNTLYKFENEQPLDLCKKLSMDLKKRRLERGLSREALSYMSGVPAPTIAKFETQNTISLVSFIAIAVSLDYSNEIKSIFSKAKYDTMQELEIINKNQNRKRGRNEFKR